MTYRVESLDAFLVVPARYNSVQEAAVAFQTDTLLSVLAGFVQAANVLQTREIMKNIYLSLKVVNKIK